MDIEKISEQKLYNEAFLDMVVNGQEKQAAQSAQKFTRMKLRENSFAEKIITPIDIANTDLDRAEDPENQVKWCDREPDQAPAITVPLGVVPDAYQFGGTRYPVYFHRKMSPMFSKDIAKLRGYNYDIRQVLLENSTKDLATTVDTTFIETVNSVMGLRDTANSFNGLGLPQYVSISGGINRDTLTEAFKVIQRLRVPFGATQPDGNEGRGCMLMNNITAQDLVKLLPSEIGWDESQDNWRSGLPSKRILGVQPIYTLKSELVPDGTFYLFSSEEFLGKYFRLQPLTVYMESKMFFLTFCQYMEIGMAIGNVKGVCRVDFV